MKMFVLRRLCEIGMIGDVSLLIFYMHQGDYSTAWMHFGIALWWVFARNLWLAKSKS